MLGRMASMIIEKEVVIDLIWKWQRIERSQRHSSARLLLENNSKPSHDCKRVE
jgi:hypothetical protein